MTVAMPAPDDAHREREDKQRVERDVEQCPREHAPHGVLRRAVRADDGRERRAQQLERDPDGDGAQIRDGLGIGRLRCAEEPDELRREQRGERREHNAAHKQERHGLADGGVRLRLLPPPECETDIGGAAVAEQERDGSDEDNEREGDVRRRHAGDADAAADENLVDDVIQEVHHQCQRRGNGIAQEKGGNRCGFQRIVALWIIRHGGNLLYIIVMRRLAAHGESRNYMAACRARRRGSAFIITDTAAQARKILITLSDSLNDPACNRQNLWYDGILG